MKEMSNLNASKIGVIPLLNEKQAGKRCGVVGEEKKSGGGWGVMEDWICCKNMSYPREELNMTPTPSLASCRSSSAKLMTRYMPRYQHTPTEAWYHYYYMATSSV